MTDSQRINALERMLWSDGIGNGIAIFPCTDSATRKKQVSLVDLGDEDGSHLGCDLSPDMPTLREAIDAAIRARG